MTAVVFIPLAGLGGCRPMDYQLLHPLRRFPQLWQESGIFDRRQLRIHWLAFYPNSPNPLPAVLVHPDAGGFAEDMKGICLDLARRGYFAVAVHYQRLEALEKKNPLFPWKSPEDAVAVLAHLRAHPRVNPERIGLLGYSKGGVLSLLIAAADGQVDPSAPRYECRGLPSSRAQAEGLRADPNRPSYAPPSKAGLSSAKGIKAVVAYYPLADFEEWLDPSRYNFPKSLLFRGIRRYFLQELGVSTWEEALPQLRAASPLRHVERIRAPVLLIHGAKDTTAPLAQVQRLCRRLKECGNSCQLMVLPHAGHVFNFRDRKTGEMAWEKTTEFLKKHLMK